MNTFGDRLLAARKAKGFTQKELASKANVSQATISDIERGRNSSSAEALPLAKALGISVESLMTGKDFAREETFPRPASEEDFAFIPLYNALGSCGDGYNNEHVEVF